MRRFVCEKTHISLAANKGNDGESASLREQEQGRVDDETKRAARDAAMARVAAMIIERFGDTLPDACRCHHLSPFALASATV